MTLLKPLFLIVGRINHFESPSDILLINYINPYYRLEVSIISLQRTLIINQLLQMTGRFVLVNI